MYSLLSDWQYKNLGLSGAWNLAYYVPEQRNSIGNLSNHILQFKLNSTLIVHKWCNWAIDEIEAKGINFDYIVRALGSKELHPSGSKPLDILGNTLSFNKDCIYAPDILSKVRETPPMHTLQTLSERHYAMNKAYKVHNKSYNLHGKNVLILDDVTTTNTTLAEILRAMRDVWPSGRYFFFCLGKTNRDLDANNLITLKYFK